MITQTTFSDANQHTFEDSFLLFGSTGLLGSLALSNLMDANLYCTKTDYVYQKIKKAPVESSNIEIKKVFYCINRKFNEQIKLHTCRENLSTNSTEVTKPLIDYKIQNTIENLTGLDYYQSSSPVNNVYSMIECGILDLGNKYKAPKTVLDYRTHMVTQQREIELEHIGTFKVAFQFLVVEIIFAGSNQWDELLPLIFSGDIQFSPFICKESLLKTIPSLDRISTMICTLGSSKHKKRSSQSDVDYELTFKLVKQFAAYENKRLVIVTSFNNILIGHLFSYFKTKLKLERDLQSKLVPKLHSLFIIRPGPLIGSHYTSTNDSTSHPLAVEVPHRLSLIYQHCWKLKREVMKEVKQIGLRTKVSEVIAKTMYRRSGSELLGYCIPASKVGLVVAIKAIQSDLNTSIQCFEIISSKQIDHMI